MSIWQAIKDFIDGFRALLSREVCSAEFFEEACAAAARDADKDSNGMISVRELLAATWRVIKARQG